MSDLPKIFTVRQVAEYLGCSQATVSRMVDAERIRAIRVGVGRRSSIRITESALREYLGEAPAPSS